MHKSLLLQNRSPGSMHEGLDLLQGEAAIFVGVHCLEYPFVSRLKLLQRDGPVTISVHQSEKHPHQQAIAACPDEIGQAVADFVRRVRSQ